MNRINDNMQKNRVILIVIYFLFITPLAIIMKILGKDMLDRKISKDAPTYWVKRPLLKTDKERLEKQ